MALPLLPSQIFAILEALKDEYPDEVTEWVASQMECEAEDISEKGRREMKRDREGKGSWGSGGEDEAAPIRLEPLED